MSNINNINIPFKFFSKDLPIELNLLNGMTFSYDINLSHNVREFMNNINYSIKRDFGISTFELILHNFGEFGQDLKQYLMSKYDNYEDINIGEITTNQTGFYVRPITLTDEDLESLKQIHDRLIETETCPVCFTRGIGISRYFDCIHEICGDCYDNWNSYMEVENRSTTCPICRGN